LVVLFYKKIVLTLATLGIFNVLKTENVPSSITSFLYSTHTPAKFNY